MAIPVIQPTKIKAGPGLILYAPLGTTIPTVTAAASKLVATFTGWLEVGGTDEGLTFTESTDTEDVRVAESLYAVRTVTTGKTGTVAFAISHINDLTWQLASNGGTITTSGAGATKTNKYVPPLAGSEVRKMLAFKSVDDDEILIWPQVFNSGGFETSRSGFADKHTLPTSFSVELPDAAVNNGLPYVRHTSGPLADFV